jgi:hypothetical protein
MVRTIILTFWELKRLLRSKRAVAAEFTLPLLGILACVIFHSPKYTTYRCLFPAAAVLSSWLILYVRSSSDRASGFAAGVDSSPAEGMIAFSARILTGITLVLTQSIVFFAIVLLLFR